MPAGKHECNRKMLAELNQQLKAVLADNSVMPWRFGNCSLVVLLAVCRWIRVLNSTTNS